MEKLVKAGYNNIQFLPENYKDLSRIYCGANCDLIVNSHTNRIQQTEDRFKIKCLDFYMELSKQILNRFNFNDPVLKFLNNFDPVVATSGTCESVVPLAFIFPQLIKRSRKFKYRMARFIYKRRNNQTSKGLNWKSMPV
ncbi:hypothetical protein NQ314_003302 [Rhamnusium bicolor]|uniref:Uncharacterized protein n=1 Tax=Rhamnusium bicolor TaxID=1586634 RepID=A0AAV8ZPK8_9CUCU|nr:hypothetical protein NQ314_003302 [Rhamnusium bicolor]